MRKENCPMKIFMEMKIDQIKLHIGLEKLQGYKGIDEYSSDERH